MASSGAKTAAIYLRRSKASVDGQTVSFDFQEAELRALLASHGVTEIVIYKDNGKSGNSYDRQPWLDWIASAKDHDFLGAWAIDRSSRGKAVLSLHPLIVALQLSGARLVTVRDRLDSADERFERDVIWEAQRAHEDWQSYSKKAHATRRSMKDKGKWPSGRAPYGTMFDCPDVPGCVGKKDGPVHDCSRQLVPNPAERIVLRDVQARLVSGEGMRSILRQLHDAGHQTRRDNAWTRTSLTTTLESETTLGHAADKPDAERWLPVDWQPVFSLAEARDLQQRLHPAPGTRRPGGRPQTYLLSGLATCAGCGRTLTTGRDAKRKVTRLVCPTTTSAAPCSARATIRADRADAEVAERFLELWGDSFWFEERVTVDGSEVDAAERARDAAQAALLADPTPELAVAYAEAKLTLETALAKPVVRNVEMVATETYRVLWERAVVTDPETGETKPDAATRAALLRGAAEAVTISKSTGPTWDPARITVLWHARLELVGQGVQTEAEPPF